MLLKFCIKIYSTSFLLVLLYLPCRERIKNSIQKIPALIKAIPNEDNIAVILGDHSLSVSKS